MKLLPGFADRNQFLAWGLYGSALGALVGLLVVFVFFMLSLGRRPGDSPSGGSPAPPERPRGRGALERLARVRLRLGDVEGALDAVHAIRDPGDRDSALYGMVVQPPAQPAPGAGPGAPAAPDLGDRVVKPNELEMYLRLAREIKGNGLRADALQEVATARAVGLNDPEGARPILDEAQAAAKAAEAEERPPGKEAGAGWWTMLWPLFWPLGLAAFGFVLTTVSKAGFEVVGKSAATKILDALESRRSAPSGPAPTGSPAPPAPAPSAPTGGGP